MRSFFFFNGPKSKLCLRKQRESKDIYMFIQNDFFSLSFKFSTT